MFPATPRFVLAATLIILAACPTLRQSLEMYKATNQWRPNRYMERLVAEGFLYFLVYVTLAPFYPSSPLFIFALSHPSLSQVTIQILMTRMLFPLDI